MKLIHKIYFLLLGLAAILFDNLIVSLLPTDTILAFPPIIIAAAIGAAVAIGTEVAKGAKEKKRGSAQQDAAKVALNGIRERMEQGQINHVEALQRIDEVFGALDTDIRQSFQKAFDSGVQNINSQLTSQLDAVAFQLEESRKTASRSEDKEIKRVQEQVQEARKGFENVNEKLRTSFGQRRLGGSGALAAALQQSGDKFKEVNTEINKISANIREGITAQLGQTERAGIFQTEQSRAAAGRNVSGLASNIGLQESQAIRGNVLGQFQAGVNEQNRFQSSQDSLFAQSLQLGTALPGLASTATPGLDILGTLGNTALNIGTDLLVKKAGTDPGTTSKEEGS